MPTTQITLTEAESLELERLSHLKGKTPEALVHEAVAALLKQHEQEKRLAALAGVRGMWRDREDLYQLELMD